MSHRVGGRTFLVGSRAHDTAPRLLVVAGLAAPILAGTPAFAEEPPPAAAQTGATPTDDMAARAPAAPLDANAPMTPETGFIPDSPRRLPDGTFFVPKPSQRLLTIRTVVVRPTEVPRTDEIPGLIAADPNASGEVQSHQTGRIEPVEGGKCAQPGVPIDRTSG